MSNRFQTPDEQFLDAAGQPYAGGFLYFYSTGSSTPLETYSNAALTIPNSNPVILDSAGRAGNIWLQDLQYKVVLTDADGLQVWTADPVQDPTFPLSSVVQSFIAGNASGTTNAITVPTPSPNTWTLTQGFLLTFIASFTNTTAATLNVASTGALAINKRRRGGLVALEGGEIVASTETTVIYDGAVYELLNETTIGLPPPATATSQDIAVVNTAVTEYGRLGIGPAASVLTSDQGLLKYITNAFGSSVSNLVITVTSDTAGSVTADIATLFSSAGQAVTLTSVSKTWSTAGTGIGGLDTGTVANTTWYHIFLCADRNLFANGSSPATQTITITSGGTYTVQLAGTGTIVLTGATTGTVTSTNPITFAAGSTSLTATVAGTVTLMRCVSAISECRSGVLLTTSTTAPSPTGDAANYTYLKYIGSVKTDGSAHQLRILQKGRKAQYVVGTNPTVAPNIANGVAVTYSNTSPTLAAVTVSSASSFVPLTASVIRLLVSNTYGGGAVANVIVAPSTAWGGTNNGPQGSAGQIYPAYLAAGTADSVEVDILLEAATIAWASGAAGGGISCIGWEVNI